MEQYTNKNMMRIKSNDEFWNEKVMPSIHKHRITHGRKTSNIGLPVVYRNPLNPKLYILDMYMYNKRQKKGKKFYHRNSLGEVVLPRMYRYIIDEETFKLFFCTETLGKNYNDVIKKAISIAKGVKVFDYMNDLDKAPTRRDVAKIAKEHELMRI